MSEVPQRKYYYPHYAEATSCIDKMGPGKNLTEAEIEKIQTLS